MSFNREMDAQSLQKERRETLPLHDVEDWDCVEALPLAGKSISQWLAELDAIAKEVEAELVEREIGCHLVEVLEAVNTVLFKSRGFKRSPVLIDSKCAYLHTVLSSGCCSGMYTFILLCYNIFVGFLESEAHESSFLSPFPQTPI